MAKLYPPVIEGTIPAFNGAVLTVPFSMNRSVSKNEISGFALKVKTVQSNTYLTTLISNTPDENVATFSINSNDWAPTPGQFYKVQLAYINNGTIGYYSTVGVIKYTAINSNNLRLIGAGGDDMTAAPSKLYGFRHDYSGVYDYSIDPMEKVYTYQFQLLNAADEVVYDSGILLHNVNQDSVNTSIDSYTFLDDLEEGETLYLQYHVTTVNGLELFTPKIAVVAIDELIVDKNITLVAENNYDNGYVQLNLHGIEEDGIEEYLVGQYRIYRCNIKTPKRWEPIASFVLQKQQPSEINNLRDFTVEHNETYKYKLCQFNDHNLLALISYSNEVYVDFEDMFLFDGERQLKIQYNPKITSFKNDILESKIDTIGSKYPFFFRNGHVHYKEFPISGLISYWADNEELFKPLKDIGIENIDNISRSNTVSNDYYDKNEAAQYHYNYGLTADAKAINNQIDEQFISKTIIMGTLTETEKQNFEAMGYYINTVKPQITRHFIKDIRQLYHVAQHDAAGNIKRNKKNEVVWSKTYSNGLIYLVKNHPQDDVLREYWTDERGYTRTEIVDNEEVNTWVPYWIEIQNWDKWLRDNNLTEDDIPAECKKTVPTVENNHITEIIKNVNSVNSTVSTYNRNLVNVNKNFLSKTYKTKDLVNYNIAAERQFKLDALEWLTNGKPKLFRSPAEGNYIVRLMNTSLTPNDTVGRMLHTFNSTAYEIDECNYYNLSNYGFIFGNAIVNNDLKLRFRTIDLMEWVERSFVKNGDYYEVLLNPYGNHGKILAQSILIEDCDYGDIFYINSTNQATNKIMIGATGSYRIENLFPIESIRFKTDEIQAFKQDGIIVPFDAVVHSPKVTYSYYDTFNGISLFDNIADISISSVPAHQFMNNNTNMWNRNIIKEIESVNKKVLKYYDILLEKRPVEEIYSIVNIPLTTQVSSMLTAGFNEEFTNRLFTFDKTGWGRGLGEMAKLNFINRNTTSGQSPFEIIRNMPFCLFHINPITLLKQDQWVELQRQSVAMANILHQAAVPDDVIRRVTNLTNTENFDALKDVCQEFLEQMQMESNPYHFTDEQISAMYSYTSILNDYVETMRGWLSERYYNYVLTTDITPKADKRYFIRLEDAELGEVYVEINSNDFIDTKDQNIQIYERVYTTIQNPDIKDLYLNYDFNKFAYDKDYYLIYDPTLFDNKGGVIIFDEGEYSTRVYFNTGNTEKVDLGSNKYVDLAEMKQSALYLDIDTLTDMYVGNGVIATLTYAYSVTTYTFEEEDALIIKRSEYTDAIDAYNTAIKNYVGWDDPDPADALSGEGNYTLGELVKQKYKEYIEVLDARLTQWRGENEANG